MGNKENETKRKDKENQEKQTQEQEKTGEQQENEENAELVNGRNVHDRSWIKHDYKKLRYSLHHTKEDVKKTEVERAEYKPYTWQSMGAYANTSIGDMAMKTNHNPVKVTPFGLRPGECISKEYCRNSTLKPVNPQKSLEIDSGFPVPYRGKASESTPRKEHNDTKDANDEEQPKETKDKKPTSDTSQNKKGKQEKKDESNQEKGENKEGEQGEEGEEDEPKT